MALSKLASMRCLESKLVRPWSQRLYAAPLQNTFIRIVRAFATGSEKPSSASKQETQISEQATDSASSKPATSSSASSTPKPNKPNPTSARPSDWDDDTNLNISHFSELPHTNFGVNQHMIINDEFKEALRQILWQFKAPIRYAFAYGSGVFPQTPGNTGSNPGSSATSIHPHAPPAVVKNQGGNPKMIDFIFGVSYTQHWHSLNLMQHRDHYSAVGSLGSGAVSAIQDQWGAGVYFHPYITVNGTLIKYGVVNLDTLSTDLEQWTTLYTAGRLHKPVKILRDDPKIRLANQKNLFSALRTALLLLPPDFTEQELYATIANISYMGDPRMSLPTEDPSKIANIVGNNLPNFRRLYAPLIEMLPNLAFNDPACTSKNWASDPTANVRLQQDMDPFKRGNMVRRLPKAFRSKLYFRFQSKYQIPQLEFNKMLEETQDDKEESSKSRRGGPFEQRIASEPPEELREEVRGIIKKTIGWPSTSQSLKGIVTGGFSRTYRYMSEKMSKHSEGKKKAAAAAAVSAADKASTVAAKSEKKIVKSEGAKTAPIKERAEKVVDKKKED